jgi:hypothetical protein
MIEWKLHEGLKSIKKRLAWIIMMGFLPSLAQSTDISGIHFSPDPVGHFEKLEIRFQVTSAYNNPFDF